MAQEKRDFKQELIQILDKLIEEGKWDGSLFLEACGKKFRDLREEVAKELGLDVQSGQDVSSEADKNHIGTVEVFIHLYQADGLNVTKWAALLGTLGSYNVSRPIYKQEEDVRNAIRNKEFKQNDGYAVIRVKEGDITLSPANTPPPTDRLGHELVLLKEKAIISDNIIRLVHQTGIYSYDKGTLTKQSSESLF